MSALPPPDTATNMAARRSVLKKALAVPREPVDRRDVGLWALKVGVPPSDEPERDPKAKKAALAEVAELMAKWVEAST